MKSTRAPLSERICDQVCLVFALWTLCSYLVVALGGTLRWLIVLFAISLVAKALVERLRTPPESWPAVASNDEPAMGPSWFAPTWSLVGLIGLLLTLPGAGASIVTWWWIVGVLGVAAPVVFLTERPRVTRPVQGRALEGGLWTLAVVCCVVTLVSHRPDVDDAHYINIAVAAVDFPAWPLLSGDMMHGIPGLPLIQPIYRCQSYELWNGALSFVTGVPAIYCFHWISAAIAALLLPLANARLFRLLTPRLWLWAVVALVVVLLGIGETHRWYGNFSFVRMWQGKSIYLFVFMPLVYTYALRFGLRPGWREWTLLCAAQISAVGCSSSALWGAPVGAAMAIASVLRPNRKLYVTLGWAALASAIVLIVGLKIKEDFRSMIERLENSSTVPGERFEEALTVVLGDSRMLVVALVSLLIAWACSPRGLARRFALMLPFVVFAVLLNPYFADSIAAHFTGPSYWRSLWALPVPLLMTLVLISPLRLAGSVRRLWTGRAIFLITLAALVAFVPRYTGLSRENGVTLGKPGLKVLPTDYEVAAALIDLVEPRAYVVAPYTVNPWVPTFHHHAYPIQVLRHLTSKPIRNFLDSDNVWMRDITNAYAGGWKLTKNATEVFRRGLDELAVQGVCFRQSPLTPETRIILRELGFERVYRRDVYEIWVRNL